MISLGDSFHIYLFGVGGTGKTTIGKELAKRHPEFMALPGSQVMVEICGVSNSDELAKLDPEFMASMEHSRYVEVVKSHPKLIMDGHGQFTAVQAQCFDLFIFLTAEEETIRERRASRGRRSQEGIGAEITEYERRKNLLEQQHNVTVHTIYNGANTTMEKTIEEIERLMALC